MSVTFCAVPIPDVSGDFNADGDVDQEDFGRLQACLSEEGIPQPDADCEPGKLDPDEDIDEADVELFLGCLSGPDTFGDEGCVP